MQLDWVIADEVLKITTRAWANANPEVRTYNIQNLIDAGHTPEDWLKPDLLDVLPELARAGQTRVVVAPVQFLADHLETLYDVDVAGREQAESAGLTEFVRIAAPNADPDFIAALANVVRGEVAAWDQANREAAWARA